MDKIKELLLNIGATPATANQICEAITSHLDGEKAKTETLYKEQVEKLKQVCLEETNAHKTELSRRVQVFLTSKSAIIEEGIKKHTAAQQTEAQSKLERIGALVEGVEIGKDTSATLKSEIAKQSRVIKTLKENLDVATKTVDRHRDISKKLLGRAKQLEKTLVEGRGSRTTTKPAAPAARRVPGKQVSTRQPVAESTTKSAKTVGTIEAIAAQIDNDE